MMKSGAWMATIHNLDYVLKSDSIVAYRISRKFVEKTGLIKTIKENPKSKQVWVNILNNLLSKNWVKFWVERYDDPIVSNHWFYQNLNFALISLLHKLLRIKSDII